MFVASGTMGNLVSVLAHTTRGDEIILGNQSHIFRSEAGGSSVLGGISFHTVPNDERGMLDAGRRSRRHPPERPRNMPRTALVCLENTQNACGGAALTQDDISSIADVAHENGLATAHRRRAHLQRRRRAGSARGRAYARGGPRSRSACPRGLAVRSARSSSDRRTTSRKRGAGARW